MSLVERDGQVVAITVTPALLEYLRKHWSAPVEIRVVNDEFEARLAQRGPKP